MRTSQVTCSCGCEQENEKDAPLEGSSAERRAATQGLAVEEHGTLWSVMVESLFVQRDDQPI